MHVIGLQPCSDRAVLSYDSFLLRDTQKVYHPFPSSLKLSQLRGQFFRDGRGEDA
jgi:hypothetical protein